LQTNAKVCKFDVVVIVNQDVLRFNVTMKYVEYLVTVLKSEDELPEILAHRFLSHLLFLHLPHQIAMAGEL